MSEPMGIMEKSATIMNYDLCGESIEGFGGWALQVNLNPPVPRLQQDGRDWKSIPQKSAASDGLRL